MDANTIQFYVQMKDLMSGGLNKLAQTSKTTFNTVRSGMIGSEKEAQTLTYSVNELRARLADVNKIRFGTVLKSEFRAATTEAKSLQAQISRMTGTGRGAGGGLFGGLGRLGSIGGLLRLAVPGLSLAGGIALGTSSVKSAMNYEKTQTAFEVLTGSKSRGDALAQNIRQSQGMLGPAAIDSAKTMLGFGIGPGEIMRDLNMLGNVSMGDAAKLKHLTLAFSEVQATGRATGREIRQFINAGFNPLAEIARTSGKSMAELREEMKKGAISAGTITQAFISATSEGGRFNDMLGKMAETSAGKAQMLSAQWANFKIDLGNALMPIADKLVSAGAILLHALTPDGPKQSETLASTQRGMIAYLETASKMAEGDKMRKSLLQDLNQQYPELFKNLDAEKATNADLLRILKDVNSEYARKVNVAKGGEDYREASAKVAGGDSMIAAIDKRIALTRAGHFDAAKNIKDQWDLAPNWGATDSTAVRQWQKLRASEEDVLNGGGWRGVNWRKRLDSLQKTQPGAELIDTFASAYSLAHDKERLSSLFGTDKKAENSFLKLASRIQKRAGNTYFTNGGGMAYGEQLKTAMDYIPRTITHGGDDDGASSLSKGISGGGPRVININGVTMKVGDKVEFHTVNLKGGVDEVERDMKEMFMRLLYSGASIQDN